MPPKAAAPKKEEKKPAKSEDKKAPAGKEDPKKGGKEDPKKDNKKVDNKAEDAEKTKQLMESGLLEAYECSLEYDHRCHQIIVQSRDARREYLRLHICSDPQVRTQVEN